MTSNGVPEITPAQKNQSVLVIPIKMSGQDDPYTISDLKTQLAITVGQFFPKNTNNMFDFNFTVLGNKWSSVNQSLSQLSYQQISDQGQNFIQAAKIDPSTFQDILYLPVAINDRSIASGREQTIQGGPNNIWVPIASDQDWKSQRYSLDHELIHALGFSAHDSKIVLLNQASHDYLNLTSCTVYPQEGDSILGDLGTTILSLPQRVGLGCVPINLIKNIDPNTMTKGSPVNVNISHIENVTGNQIIGVRIPMQDAQGNPVGIYLEFRQATTELNGNRIYDTQGLQIRWWAEDPNVDSYQIAKPAGSDPHNPATHPAFIEDKEQVRIKNYNGPDVIIQQIKHTDTVGSMQISIA